MCRLTLNHLKFLIQTKQASKKNYTPIVLSLLLVKKRIFAAVQSKNATTHCYTLEPTISLDGRLFETIYLCLQEQGGESNVSRTALNSYH